MLEILELLEGTLLKFVEVNELVDLGLVRLPLPQELHDVVQASNVVVVGMRDQDLRHVGLLPHALEVALQVLQEALVAGSALSSVYEDPLALVLVPEDKAVGATEACEAGVLPGHH
eukprot:CAMPEP_0168615258 /NCGR_PEP_ID=MMETSP0449_2-20121227/4411_1 /TAXON_ID=1082188 /ORGANISM="Strombidium rassoulzadegani, Strain ras09" /LENGTH=115 /DNA_ID=CAMNT_0008655991 /DNA_START=611 /DNA_END=958 /DNA_ORIENTATION=-